MTSLLAPDFSSAEIKVVLPNSGSWRRLYYLFRTFRGAVKCRSECAASFLRSLICSSSGSFISVLPFCCSWRQCAAVLCQPGCQLRKCGEHTGRELMVSRGARSDNECGPATLILTPAAESCPGVSLRSGSAGAYALLGRPESDRLGEALDLQAADDEVAPRLRGV